MKDYENIVFSASGITSWGDTWEWTFYGGVTLKAPDGHTLLVTDLNPQIIESDFKDNLFDCSFSMSPKQDIEWGQICWNCQLLESIICSLAWKSFSVCANQLVQEFKTKNTDVTLLSDDEFDDMLTTCLNAIKKQCGWNSDELEWLFNYDGPMRVIGDEWLTAILEEQKLQVRDK